MSVTFLALRGARSWDRVMERDAAIIDGKSVHGDVYVEMIGGPCWMKNTI